MNVVASRPAHLPPKAEQESEHHRSLAAPQDVLNSAMDAISIIIIIIIIIIMAMTVINGIKIATAMLRSRRQQLSCGSGKQ